MMVNSHVFFFLILKVGKDLGVVMSPFNFRKKKRSSFFIIKNSEF